MFCSRYLIVNLYDVLSSASKSYDQVEQSTRVKNQYEITVYGIYRRVSCGHCVKQKAGVLVQLMAEWLKRFRIKKNKNTTHNQKVSWIVL